MGLAENIKRFRERAKLSQAALAKGVGVSQPTIAQLETGENKTTKHIFKIARELRISPRDLDPELPATAGLETKIIGYVGAGSEAHYYDGADEPDPEEMAPMPSDGTPFTVAVQIRGTSLGAGFNQWLVYYDDDEKQVPSPAMLRRLCVVWLNNGKVLVKWVHPGSRKGLYHLHSVTEGVLEDQSVREWVAVKTMKPRY